MALETATYINQLVSTNPPNTDPKSQGDDHLRMIKATLQATFPNITGAITADQSEINKLDGCTASTAELNKLTGVTVTTAEINYLAGVTSALQTQINTLTAAVTGLRLPIGAIHIAVVSTNPATTLGYGTWTAFGTGRTLVGIDTGSTEFDVVEETGGEKTHTLTEAEIPAHTHAALNFLAGGAYYGNLASSSSNSPNTSGSTGGGQAHNNLQPYIVVYMWKRTA